MDNTLDEKLQLCDTKLKENGINIDFSGDKSFYKIFSARKLNPNMYYLIYSDIDVSDILDELFNEEEVSSFFYKKCKKNLYDSVKNILAIIKFQIGCAGKTLKNQRVELDEVKYLLETYSNMPFNLEEFEQFYLQIWDKMKLDKSLYVLPREMFKSFRDSNIDLYTDMMCRKHKITMKDFEYQRENIERFNEKMIPVDIYTIYNRRTGKQTTIKKDFYIGLDRCMDLDCELYERFCEKSLENQIYFDEYLKDKAYAILPYIEEFLKNKNEVTVTKFLIQYKALINMSFGDFIFLLGKKLDDDNIKAVYTTIRNASETPLRRRFSVFPSFDMSGEMIMFRTSDEESKYKSLKFIIDGNEVTKEVIGEVVETLKKNEIPLFISIVNYSIKHYVKGDFDDFLTQVLKTKNPVQKVLK